ncbi:MAG TPA: ATP-binding protein [Desulfobacteraceae bacterium]|nr:ATP-binding protein [Desulfobacteraceae bacterium]
MARLLRVRYRDVLDEKREGFCELFIFEEFIGRPDLPQVYGTGLGLSIVRETARRHRGEAWLSTTADGNTVFFISIARHF